MKTLYIHIGTGKTGTSAIQDCFFNNEETFLSHDLLFAQSGRVINNHHLLCFNYFRRTGDYSKVKRAIAQLKQEIAETSASRILVSSEYFPDVTAEEAQWYIDELSDVCQISIIVYFRRPDDFVESWFAQSFKAGNLRVNKEHLQLRLIEEKILNYRFHVDKWAKLLGHEHVFVRPYQRSKLLNQNVVEDFLALFDLESLYPELNHPDKVVNPSTPVKQIELIQALLPYVDEQILLQLSKPMNYDDSAPKKILSHFERKMLLHVCSPYLNWLNNHYADAGENFFDLLPSKGRESRDSEDVIDIECHQQFLRFAHAELDSATFAVFLAGYQSYLQNAIEHDGQCLQDLHQLKAMSAEIVL